LFEGVEGGEEFVEEVVVVGGGGFGGRRHGSVCGGEVRRARESEGEAIALLFPGLVFDPSRMVGFPCVFAAIATSLSKTVDAKVDDSGGQGLV